MIAVTFKQPTGSWHVGLALFSASALMMTALPWQLRVTIFLLSGVYLYAHFYQARYRPKAIGFLYMQVTQQYLLQDGDHQLHLATLQPDCYQSQYVIGLTWHLLGCKKAIHVLLLRPQYDQNTWRTLSLMAISSARAAEMLPVARQ